MAVVYWRSSSGALSFRSKVSMATTTRDTWLGLSGRNRQLRTESHTCGRTSHEVHVGAPSGRIKRPGHRRTPRPTRFNGARLTRLAKHALSFGWWEPAASQLEDD